MPNDCWNDITITCKNIESIEEFNNLITNELLYKENNEYKIIKKGTRGIIFTLWSAWKPDFKWLENLLDKYPNCWIKNEWCEEGGLAGVWIGCVKNNNKDIKSLIWEDLCIEEKYFLFLDENKKK